MKVLQSFQPEVQFCGNGSCVQSIIFVSSDNFFLKIIGALLHSFVINSQCNWQKLVFFFVHLYWEGMALGCTFH